MAYRDVRALGGRARGWQAACLHFGDIDGIIVKAPKSARRRRNRLVDAPTMRRGSPGRRRGRRASAASCGRGEVFENRRESPCARGSKRRRIINLVA